MNYKKAFTCKKCPGRNDELGCPCWVEFMETNIVSGEERLWKGCIFAALPRMLVEVIKASNRPAGEISAMRCEIVNGFTQLAGTPIQVLLAEAQKQLSGEKDGKDPNPH